MKTLLACAMLLLSLSAFGEEAIIAPIPDQVAVLTVIEQDTLITTRQTRLFIGPRAAGFKKILLPWTPLYPTGKVMTSGKWIEVTDDYSKYGPAGEMGWVPASDVLLLTKWQGK